MIRVFHACAAVILLLAASAVSAEFHLFRIEQLYSNASGTVQFVVMHEASNSNFENVWGGNRLTITDSAAPMDPYGYGMPPSSSRFITFPSNLPSTATAGRRVLIATPGFAALGLVTPDFMMPAGFLPVDGGTLNYAGADQITYSGGLPTDGVSAIDRNGATIPNVATNFAGASASVTAVPPPVAFVPQIGLWWNPNESGSGYNFDIKNGTIAITIFSYEAGGHSEWYLSSGSMTDNNTKYTGTLDKYRNGQCISCSFTGMPTMIGNDGTISITFTSATSAVLSLPNNRTTTIQPLL